MSFLHDCCKKVRHAAEMAMEKTSEIMENAAFGIKAKALEARLDEQYEKLGALTYRRIRDGEENGDEETAVIAAIEELLAKLEALKNDAGDEPTDQSAGEPADEPMEQTKDTDN